MENQGINPEISFRSELGKLQPRKKTHPQQFKFTGDTATVAFDLPNGFVPTMVFSTTGAIFIEGSAEDYTVSQTLNIHTVTLAVAPAAADFLIFGELV